MTAPVVSFAIASYNSAKFLEAAVASALSQRQLTVEVLIIDDRSTDDSWALAQRLAAADNRIRTWQLPENRGPASARNFALSQVYGTWFAVLDSDDLVHPNRCAELIAEATCNNADLVADDLLVFDEERSASPKMFLSSTRAKKAGWINLADYLNETRMFGRSPNLGFLKPIIRVETLNRLDVRYDEQLRIGEDDDLILRLLLRGARYRLLPRPLYFYRKHGQSISRRLSVADADRMLAACDHLATATRDAPRAENALFARREKALRHACAFTQMIDAIRDRRAILLACLMLANPGAVPLMWMPLAGALAKLRRRAPVRKVSVLSDPEGVVFISRQRIAGATNGSSAYLLALADAVRASGKVPHLIQPSPLIFGRTPFFRLRPELDVFATIRVRGAIRIGRYLVARDAGIIAAAVRGLVTRLLRRVGIGGVISRDRKAPYSVAAPWTRDDLLYVAKGARDLGTVALADYIFQTDAFPYLLEPALRTGIVMHDLFSARHVQFDDAGAEDSVVRLSEAREIELLGRADAVIAIQKNEADFVRTHVPHVRAILAPMAGRPVSKSQPGDSARLLFVGSDTAPNVHGLNWFLERVWPAVLRSAPDSVLDVVGTVRTSVVKVPPGVRLRGLVDDLAPYYAAAGIVVSPLLQGSGLKIKLIEALRYGKATIVTGVTLQGVEALLGRAVVQADTAEAFIAAILSLQRDPMARQALAETALDAVYQSLSPDSAYAGLRDWLVEPDRHVNAEAI
jgi:succinoglycan biosynthesis protein ExoO